MAAVLKIIWLPSVALLNGTVVFLDPENTSLDTKISIVYNLETDILIEVCFYMAAIMKIDSGRHQLLF